MMSLVITGVIFAQDAPVDKKAHRAAKKELKNAKIQKQYEAMSSLLDSMAFVLEANTLSYPSGTFVNVPSNLNFIMVDSITGVIQVGSNHRIGANGVGGVTAKGNISRWKLSKNDKNKSFGVTFSLMSSIGIYDVTMYISSDGTANATLTGITPGQLYFKGRILNFAESRVYEGHSI